MTHEDHTAAPPGSSPAGFLAAHAALTAINSALRDASSSGADGSSSSAPSRTAPEHALAALLLLREVREQLATWEPGLIETARAAGASWADLAHPLGVASRQAAERRYLRVRPGASGSTGEERVHSTRQRRAADRSVTAWARGSAADLRRLAGEITALTDLPATAAPSLAHLTGALGNNDASALLPPLAESHTHLRATHPDLADRVETITRHTAQLRNGSTGAPNAG
jgi:hypothetical protein